ncbi:hypothetical protein CEP54_014689 [Fusarium duplospermum]|uniref:Uncharacterized protein n=1 Tax=Fusarium duplospermum TaxID=1325734 RepID=A0A428NUI9_9HYPO|nr:hypothetical protein CEP54_014689 [Fusarium duplospermum]
MAKSQEDICNTHKQILSRELGISVEDLTEYFNTGSVAFWKSLREFIRENAITNGDQLEEVYPVLYEASHLRRVSPKQGSGVCEVWQPADLKATRELMNQLDVHAQPASAPPTPTPCGDSTPVDMVKEPGVHVIFCGITHYKDLAEQDFVVNIPCWPERWGDGAALDSLTVERLQELEDILGPGLVSNIGLKNQAQRLKGKKEIGDEKPSSWEQEIEDKKAYVHQKVMIMIWAEQTRRVSVEYHNWDWVVRLVEKGSTALAEYVQTFDKPVIFFAPLESPDWAIRPNLHRFYDAIEMADAPRGNVSVYPSRYETWNQGHKLRDLRALDEIAKGAPDKFAWRPKTCFGLGMCALADETGKTVIKGTFSSCGEHVEIVTDTNDGTMNTLRCTRPTDNAEPSTRSRGTKKHTKTTQKPTKKSPAIQEHDRHYFHQNFIRPLQTWGEIRVFMKGNEVSLMAFSIPRGEDETEFMAFDGDRHFCFGPTVSTTREGRKAKDQELRDFCQWWQKQLLERYPDLFETLRVGCRLDVGISQADLEGHFFVNEVTRWSAAGFFGINICAAPYDKMCQIFGEKFAEMYGRFIERENNG